MFIREIWQDCVLLHSPSLELSNEGLDSDFVSDQLKLYQKSINKQIEFNVWYDTIENKVFGMDQNWKNSTSKKSSFISSPEDFITKNEYNLKYVLDIYGRHFGKDVFQSNEIIYLNNNRYKDFKGSKILVLAGGPSAKNYDWNPEDYDYIFSCNHFYLSPKINKINVDFAVIGNEVKLSQKNEKFHEYFSKHNTLLCFEDRMSKSSTRYFRDIRNQYKDRCVYMHPRYRGKPGVGCRLLLYASFFEPAEIHFAGIDGMAHDTKKGDLHDHAFQVNKCYSHKNLDYGIYRRHYVLLWDYIINYLKLNEKIKFQNLGEGMQRNQSTSISENYFPLESR